MNPSNWLLYRLFLGALYTVFAMTTRIVQVYPANPLFKEVIALGDKNKSTLGLLTHAAFQDAASQSWLLAAVNEHDHLLGYSVFRATRGREVAITHLCVAQNFRGHGVARALVDEIVQRYSHFHGIRARCRIDYESNAAWQKLGFTAIAERPGRGAASIPLVCYWRQLQPDLFQEATKEDTRLCAVMDANVFYKLQDDDQHALHAPWLQSIVDLRVTDELNHEILRCKDGLERKRRRGFASAFHKVTSDNLGGLKKELARHFPSGSRSESRESDLIQLASAIRGKAAFFLTNDDLILSRADAIQGSHGIRIAKPAEMLLMLSEAEDAGRFGLARFAGALDFRRLNASDLRKVYSAFLNHGAGEKRGEFNSRLHNYALADHMQVWVIEWKGIGYQALIAEDRSSPSVLKVHMIRVAKTPHQRLMEDFLPSWLVARSVEDGRNAICVQDVTATPTMLASLDHSGFARVPGADGYWRLALNAVIDPTSLHTFLADLGSSVPDLLPLTRWISMRAGNLRIGSRDGGADVVTAERLLWPLRFADSGVPTFIIPIQPQWAAHLFDEGIAAATLFGAVPQLMLSQENVYYRSPRKVGLAAPARILWYVSGSRDCQGSKSIRACSTLSDVRIGPWKRLYSRYHHLGIYDEEHVEAAAKNGNVTALRFGPSIRFQHPVDFRTLQQITKRHLGSPQQFVSPLRITDECFLEIYRRGITGT